MIGVLILFHPHVLSFFHSLTTFQDSGSSSKILWLDEIQHAVGQANTDRDRAKQCKPSPPPAAQPALLVSGYASEFLY